MFESKVVYYTYKGRKHSQKCNILYMYLFDYSKPSNSARIDGYVECNSAHP